MQIEKFGTASSADELQHIFHQFLAKEGFPILAVGSVTNPLISGKNSHPEIYTGDQIEQRTWREEWKRRGYNRYDPNVLRVLRTQSPFTWASTYEMADSLGRRILDQAREFGLSNGLSVPVHSIDKVPGIISISGDRADDLTESELAIFGAVCMHFFVSWSSYFEHTETVEPLTNRERDLLYFVQGGLTGESLADAMGISVHTTRNHMANLRRKLGANSMAHAVAKAIHHRIISP